MKQILILSGFLFLASCASKQNIQKDLESCPKDIQKIMKQNNQAKVPINKFCAL